ncbi:D-alanyl-D-alanine carboxypeptidase/D-alanyl-D-alanine-endopeptidase [Paradesertivirga mongoliensis]|uniref:D-alanyl-D-alanine carboxypeptidase/D-alanyl-D-alanine-endopeptidase n=1 Tax=Paradesertivirga mongoliensis TaxID=2100740 RepID=A0ABW4ZLU6_9SPHI|nr:D-alanyl-D-alanine carboxypeptidase/D-alanyl-D-alanine-endopeptidase [Pedobacter mongoliensis]
MMKKHFLPLLLILTQVSCAQTSVPNIDVAYSRFENDSQLRYGLSSLTVLNAKTGEVVFSKNGHIGLAPASTLKVVTSASAFHILGQDFRWETTLCYNGSIVNGILNGDLIIRGGGDPTLGSDRYAQSKPEALLNRWAAAIKKAGIKKINGRLIADDSLFGTQITPLGWIWQDIGNYYGAGASSLSWKENEIGVRFRAGVKAGDKTELLGAVSNSTDLKLVNEVTTGNAGSGDNVYAYSAPYTDIVYLRGTYGIDLKKTIMISMPDPALTLARELKSALDDNGISIAGQASTARLLDLEKEKFLPPATVIDEYQSPLLRQIIYWLNQKSLNLYGENLIKSIALKQGKAATTENGISEIKKFWSSKLKMDPNALAILDGSGLSPENRITTLAMASILQSAAKEPWYSSLYESLPENNKIKMKSGSIRNVLAYTGYHKSSSGTPLVFTFITNNYNGSTSAIKQKMFKVLDELK